MPPIQMYGFFDANDPGNENLFVYYAKDATTSVKFSNNVPSSSYYSVRQEGVRCVLLWLVALLFRLWAGLATAVHMLARPLTYRAVRLPLCPSRNTQSTQVYDGYIYFDRHRIPIASPNSTPQRYLFDCECAALRLPACCDGAARAAARRQADVEPRGHPACGRACARPRPPTRARPHLPAAGQYGPSGVFAAAEGFYVTMADQGVLLLAMESSTPSLTGWSSKTIVSGLDNPGLICGSKGTWLYILTGKAGTYGTPTKLSRVDLSDGSTADLVTGQTALTACSMDIGGTGDVIVAVGGDIKVLAGGTGSAFSAARRTVALTSGNFITSVVGDTTSDTYLAATSGETQLDASCEPPAMRSSASHCCPTCVLLPCRSPGTAHPRRAWPLARSCHAAVRLLARALPPPHGAATAPNPCHSPPRAHPGCRPRSVLAPDPSSVAGNTVAVSFMTLVRVAATTTPLLTNIDPTMAGTNSYTSSDGTSTRVGFSMVLNSQSPPTLYIAYTQDSKPLMKMANAFTRSASDATTNFGGTNVYPSKLTIRDNVVYGAGSGAIFKACE